MDCLSLSNSPSFSKAFLSRTIESSIIQVFDINRGCTFHISSHKYVSAAFSVYYVYEVSIHSSMATSKDFTISDLEFIPPTHSHVFISSPCSANTKPTKSTSRDMQSPSSPRSPPPCQAH